MRNYQDLLKDIRTEGSFSSDRTGVGTSSLFGTRLEWDLQEGFPAVTHKRLAWKSVVSELLWFLRYSTNVDDLREILHGSRTEGKTVWDANYESQAKSLGYSGGELGPIYGAQFKFENQLQTFIEDIKSNPNSRRHIITLWNPAELHKMALPPCHGIVIQAYVNNKELSIQWYQRSVDTLLGLPFNIASYALFTHIIAKLTGLIAKKLIFVGGDTHIYNNHTKQCLEAETRETFNLPELQMSEFSTLEDVVKLNVQDFKLVGYKHGPSIEASMAV